MVRNHSSASPPEHWQATLLHARKVLIQRGGMRGTDAMPPGLRSQNSSRTRPPCAAATLATKAPISSDNAVMMEINAVVLRAVSAA